MLRGAFLHRGVSRSLALVGVLVVPLSVACGSSESNSLFNGEAKGKTDAGKSVGGAEAGGASTSGSGGATNQGGGGAPNGGTASGAGGANISKTDAGRDAGSGAAPPVDSGTVTGSGGTLGVGGTTASGGASGSGTATPHSVACMGGPCASVCCHGALAGVECLPLICPSGGAPLACDDAADCTGGKLCCGKLSTGATCQTTCTNGQFCRTNAECPSGQCDVIGEDKRYSECK